MEEKKKYRNFPRESIEEALAVPQKIMDEMGGMPFKRLLLSESLGMLELGAASLLYEDRIVIFKEKGIHFPTNFQSIGYIEFEVDSIDAKTSDLLKELIGFGLVKVTPT
jgi:hypothetical protein